jgi:hypothetical protein
MKDQAICLVFLGIRLLSFWCPAEEERLSNPLGDFEKPETLGIKVGLGFSRWPGMGTMEYRLEDLLAGGSGRTPERQSLHHGHMG